MTDVFATVLCMFVLCNGLYGEDRLVDCTESRTTLLLLALLCAMNVLTVRHHCMLIRNYRRSDIIMIMMEMLVVCC